MIATATTITVEELLAKLPPIFRDCLGNPNSSTRYDFSKPIRFKGLIVATDSCIAVWMISDLPTPAEDPNRRLPPIGDVAAIMLRERYADAAVELPPVIPIDEQCDVCGGSSKIDGYPCDECDGRGTNPQQVQITVGPTHLNSKYIVLLRKHGIDKVYPSKANPRGGPVYFTADGGIGGALMPMNKD